MYAYMIDIFYQLGEVVKPSLYLHNTLSLVLVYPSDFGEIPCCI